MDENKPYLNERSLIWDNDFLIFWKVTQAPYLECAKSLIRLAGVLMRREPLYCIKLGERYLIRSWGVASASMFGCPHGNRALRQLGICFFLIFILLWLLKTRSDNYNKWNLYINNFWWKEVWFLIDHCKLTHFSEWTDG